MKKYIRSYHMFLPGKKWVKACIYLLYPFIVIGTVCLLRYKLTYYPVICMGLACVMTTMAEIFFDYFIFGGIASRETNKLEYLKTSVRGISMLKSSLAADIIRRFLSITIIISGSYLAAARGIQTEEHIFLHILWYIFCVFFLIETGLFITRFFMNTAGSMLVCVVLGNVAALPGCFVPAWDIQIWVAVLLAAAGAAAGMAVTGRRFILKRAEESYYDR